MPREVVSIIDPVQGDLVTPAEYGARLSERRRCRTGSPQIILDYAPWEPVKSPLDGSMITSRADLREQERIHNVRCCGETGYLENHKPEKPERPDNSKLIHDQLTGEVAIHPKVKAISEGRLDTPEPIAPLGGV